MRFPGTSLYRSPQSWLFEVQFHGDATARYPFSPADDLYALGVTACRLLTGEYPEFPAPCRDENGILHLEGVQVPRSLLKSPYIEPTLRAVILRLLSLEPKQRGSAAQLAQQLELALRPFQPSSSEEASDPVRTETLPRRERYGWALVAVVLALVIGVSWALLCKLWQERAEARAALSGAEAAKAGTAGVGDAASSMAVEKAPAVSTAEGMSEDTLPEPIPGQVRPDSKGRCPGRGMVALNGGCWWDATGEPEKCLELGGEMFKGTCYVPVIPPGRKRPPTSSPMKRKVQR